MSRPAGITALVLFFCIVGTAQSASLCLAPSMPKGLNVTYDCDYPTPVAHANAWMGYETSDSAPCESEPPYEVPCEAHSLTEYGWYVSSSPSDHTVNRGPIENNQLYLWLGCTYHGGMTESVFSFAGTLEVVDITGINGFLIWSESLPDVHIYVGGCPNGPVSVGVLTVQDPSPVEGESWGRAKARYK